MNNPHKTLKTQKSQGLKSKNPPGRCCYPFAGIVGQQEMKLALVLNVISPSIGGVLIMGHRGTGKSTVVRALADLLPEISVVAGCAYRCDPTDEQNLCDGCQEQTSRTKLRREMSPVPVVDLPLGATEDRVCGTIDIEHALRAGAKRFEPGLLARANRGFLYIDEVNLLEDHLVDLLLDVAATGVNKVERESISVEHPASFVLIGSGNPEEGELRPQLLDRFGIYVEVKTEEDIERRVEIIERREAFERDPASFRIKFADEQEQLRQKTARARKILANVKVERRILQNIARLCSELRVDGHRGELTITRVGRALAAFEGRKTVTEDDVRRVAVMSLRHRLRRDALDETGGTERIEQALEQVFGKAGGRGRHGQRPSDDSSGGSMSDDSSRDNALGGGMLDGRRKQDRGDRAAVDSSNGCVNAARDGSFGAEAPAQPTDSAIEVDLPRLRFEKGDTNLQSQPRSSLVSSRARGIRRAAYSNDRGRYARSVSFSAMSGKLALDATLRAAAGLGFSVRSSEHGAVTASPSSRAIPGSALRFKLFKRKQGRLFIFALDLSGSMALKRLGQAKSAILALLRESYIQRDSVAIIGFRGTSAELLLPPSRSVLRASRALDSVGVGGGTPLSAGLACSLNLSKRVGSRAGEIFLLVFTDGQANVPIKSIPAADRSRRQRQIDLEIIQLGAALNHAGVSTVVISTHDPYRLDHAAERIAGRLGARYESTSKSDRMGS